MRELGGITGTNVVCIPLVLHSFNVLTLQEVSMRSYWAYVFKLICLLITWLLYMIHKSR